MTTVILNFISGILKDGVTSWMKNRGGLHFAIGVTSPPEYITRATWDIDAQKMVFNPPIFIEYRLPLNISNMSGADRYMTVRGVWFSQNPPEFTDDGWKLPGTSLHPMGVKVEDSDGKETKVIKIPPNGMVSVVIKGTNTDPTIGGKPFREWKHVLVAFEMAGGKSKYLVMKVEGYGDGRVCQPTVQPTFPIPDHYARSQGGLDLPPELRRRFGVTT
jgi:hypothetical protein